MQRLTEVNTIIDHLYQLCV